MIRGALRTLSLPITLPLSWALRRLAHRSLGRSGLIELALGGEQDGHPLLMLAALERVMHQTSARGVLIHLRGFGVGWATLAEWREALLRFREDGRLVIVSVEAPGNGDMYLASAADRIVMASAGEIAMLGIGGTLTFMGAALEKLGLSFDVESAGAYKSAGESLSRTFATPENREATEAILDDLHGELVRAVAKGRKLEPEAVQALIDRAPLHAEAAKEAGLVDVLGYEDAIQTLIEELLGEDVHRIPLGALSWKLRAAERVEGFLSGWPAIAVLHMEGGVVMGDAPSRNASINARLLPPVIRQLKENDRVKAVVLAINSPGGSALASDIIWRDIELLSREKPVIAALGDVAASGGYYVAAPASEIIARPSTLTGSIGVVGGKLVTGGAMAKLGIFAEQISRGKNAGMYNSLRPFDADQRLRFRERLKETYGTFLRRVAAGRHKPIEDVDAVAQGRVWSGRAAKERGLVDRLGGLAQAMERARVLTSIRPGHSWRRVDILVRPPRRWLLQALPARLGAKLAAAGIDVGGSALPVAPAALLTGAAPLELMAAGLGVRAPLIAHQLASSPGQPLAMLPAELEIE